MQKCDARAIARCPDREACGDHVFADGSDCDKLNQKILLEKPTKADRLRLMNDKELTDFLTSVFCAGMQAEERGDDFLHSFPWTLDRLRQQVEE